MKKTDKASPSLLKAMHDQQALPPDDDHRAQGRFDKKPYLTITLTNVLVSSYWLDSAGGGATKPNESLSLNFTKIEYKYSTQ